jgi:hypothetical protein
MACTISRASKLPEPGARVRLEVDAKGFLRSVELLEPPTPATTPAS